MLSEFDKRVEALRSRHKPVFWPIFVPKAEDMHRWRVQLECGCLHEVFTRGKADYPDDGSWLEPIMQRPLPVGEYWCTNDHGEAGRAYRDVVEWLEREVKELPPDPAESPYEGMDPETWAKVRHAEPHSTAFWRVRLSCGHFKVQVATDVDWRPEDGPKLSTEKRAAEMRRELESMWSAGLSGVPRSVAKHASLRCPTRRERRECTKAVPLLSR